MSHVCEFLSYGRHYRMLNDGGSEKDIQGRIGTANYAAFRRTLKYLKKNKRLGLQTKIGLRLYEYRVVSFLHITIVLKHAA